MRRLVSLRVVLPLLAALATATVVLAGPGATLTGRVTDPTGGVIVGVKVTATNIETNITYETETNKEGLYSIPNLPPGTYRVVVGKHGFRTIVKPGVELHVQDVIALNFSMDLGSIVESVTVEEGAPLLQAETGMLGTTVDQTALTELPSLTRNPYDFVSLSPGSVASGIRGRGVGVAVNGQRVESGSFLLDGSENRNPADSTPAQAVPLDAVREYRLQTHAFTAEYGRNVAFVANVVTKSGGNDFHGVLYDFMRNSSLAANTFQNNATRQSRPVFNRHQFGGTLGGPIRRDRAFFFIALEPIVVRSSAPVRFYVPTPQLVTLSSPGTQAIFRRFPLPAELSSTDVRVHSVCPYSASCNPQTGAGLVTLPAFAATTRVGPRDAGGGPPQDTYLATGRLDYAATNRTTLWGRYAVQDATVFATVTQPYSAELDRPTLTRNQNITLDLIRSWTGRLITESRAVYSRIAQTVPQTPAGGFPTLDFLGSGVALPSGLRAQDGPQNVYQFHHTASWLRGKHDFKFGGQYVHLRQNVDPSVQPVSATNYGSFGSVQNLVDGRLATYQIWIDPKGRVPGETAEPPFEPARIKRHARFQDFALFLQDTWKATSRLSLSPGLRYEYFGAGHPPEHEQALSGNFYLGEGSTIFEQIANGRLLRVADAPAEYRNRLFLSDRNNFGPRLGLVYDLTGHGTTLFRSGAGIFYERTFSFPGAGGPPAYTLAVLTNVPVTVDLLTNPYSLFPNMPVPIPPSAITIADPDGRKRPYVVAWNAGFEREVASRLVLAATYVASSGNRLHTVRNVNRQGSGRFVGRPGERLVRTLAAINWAAGNLGHSTYHGLQLRADSGNMRSLGLQFSANYTWSHSMDNASSRSGEPLGGSGGFLLDPFNPALDKGPSHHDVRHRFVTHFIWHVPVGRHESGYRRHVLGGWEMSGILSFQTGQPFNLLDYPIPGGEVVDHYRPRVTGPLPELLRDGRRVSDRITPNQFLVLPLNAVRNTSGCIPDAAPFACQLSPTGPYEGTIGRNFYRQPGTHFQSVALMKNFDLSRALRREGARLRYRAELYNVFNHSNLYVTRGTSVSAPPSFNTASGQVRGVLASFGTPPGAGAPQEARQIVMALKLIF